MLLFFLEVSLALPGEAGLAAPAGEPGSNGNEEEEEDILREKRKRKNEDEKE